MSAVDLLNEVVFLLPDAIVFGSLLIGILTTSHVQILFFFSLLESLGFLYGIQAFVASIYGASKNNNKCKSKYHNLSFTDLIPTLSASNPPYTMYIVSFASTYIAASLYSLQEELDVLDGGYKKKYTTSATILGIATILYGIYLLIFKCAGTNGFDNIGYILLASVSGFAIGLLILQQNVQLFGKSSINFLGIPLLRNKTADGSPIYLCT
jgi:hypothetical protein